MNPNVRVLKNTDLENYKVVSSGGNNFRYKYSFVMTDTGNTLVAVTNTDKIIVDLEIQDKGGKNKKVKFKEVSIVFNSWQKDIDEKTIELPSFAEMLGKDFLIKDKTQLSVSIDFPIKTSKKIKLTVSDEVKNITEEQAFSDSSLSVNKVTFNDISSLINNEGNSLKFSGKATFGTLENSKVQTIKGENATVKIDANVIIPLKLAPATNYNHVLASQFKKIDKIQERIKSGKINLNIKNKFGVPLKLSFGLSRTEKKDDAKAELLSFFENRDIGRDKTIDLSINLGKKEKEYLTKDSYIQLEVILLKNDNAIVFGKDNLIEIDIKAEMEVLFDLEIK